MAGLRNPNNPTFQAGPQEGQGGGGTRQLLDEQTKEGGDTNPAAGAGDLSGTQGSGQTPRDRQPQMPVTPNGPSPEAQMGMQMNTQAPEMPMAPSPTSMGPSNPQVHMAQPSPMDLLGGGGIMGGSAPGGANGGLLGAAGGRLGGGIGLPGRTDPGQGGPSDLLLMLSQLLSQQNG